MSRRDRGAPFVENPPFIKGAIRADVETLFRRRDFGEGVTNVGAINEEIFSHSNSIEEARACLIDAVGEYFRGP